MLKQSTERLRSIARRFAQSERGTQLVELAIVLPIMLMLFGAAAEFGRFFYTYQTLTKATRAGSRYLTTATPGAASDAAARNLVVYGSTTGGDNPVISGLDPSHIEITREGGSPALPERVTVRIEGFTYQPIFNIGTLVGSDGLSLNVELRPSTTMRSLSTIPS